MTRLWARFVNHLHAVPRGVPQIYGAIVAAAVVGILAALHVTLFGGAFELNWTYLFAFVGLNALVAIGTVIYRRSR